MLKTDIRDSIIAVFVILAALILDSVIDYYTDLNLIARAIIVTPLAFALMAGIIFAIRKKR